MDASDSNDPAFPRSSSGQVGMSIRDLLAAVAMQAIVANGEFTTVENNEPIRLTASLSPGLVAKVSYQIADAMIVASGGTPGCSGVRGHA